MNEVGENSINIRELFGMLRKRIKLIIAFIVLAVAIGAAYTFFIAKPIYQASIQLSVKLPNSDTSGTNAGAASGNILLVNTINQLIVSPSTLEQVRKNLNLTENLETLKSNITASNTTNSLIININVRNQNKNSAKEIALETAKVFSKGAPDSLNVTNVKVLPYVTIDPSPVSPNKKLNLVAAFVIGLLIGSGLAILLELLDNTINSEEDMEQILGKPLLGIVPLIENGNSMGGGTTLASKSSGRNGKNNRRRR